MSNREIDVRVSTFVSELEALIRSAALEAVQAALGAAPTPKKAAAAPKASKPAAPKANKPAAPKASKPAAKASQAAAAPKASQPAPKASEPAAPKATEASAPKASEPKAAAPAKAPALPVVKKGARRSAADVAAAARAIKAHLAANPGQGVEAIAKALGVPSKDLALPIANLLGARSIRKEGEKRGTRYFVTGSSEGKAPLAPEPKAAAPAPAPAPAAKKADKPAKGKKGKKN